MALKKIKKTKKPAGRGRYRRILLRPVTPEWQAYCEARDRHDDILRLATSLFIRCNPVAAAAKHIAKQCYESAAIAVDMFKTYEPKEPKEPEET